jgi:hypothetical protein
MVQMILYVPFFESFLEKVPFVCVRDVNFVGPDLTVTLCGLLPFQTHFTVVPFFTLTVRGLKKLSPIETVFVAANAEAASTADTSSAVMALMATGARCMGWLLGWRDEHNDGRFASGAAARRYHRTGECPCAARSVDTRHHGAVNPDDLYGLPLERFVQERGSLARALRKDGRRDEAAAVAGLRKPSVAGWAVNQLVRSQGVGIRELFEAGDALRAAQADLLAGGGDARVLRAARERERAAVDGLVDTARGLLTSEGHELSPAVIERVLDTLHAAALDEDARERVRAGRLQRELRHVGLGLGLGEAAAVPSPASPSTTPTNRDAGEQATKPRRTKLDPEARERAAEAARVERERAAARKAARAAETAAQRRVQSAARALRDAEDRRERAARALAEADQALAAARAEAAGADDALRRARADLESL